MHSYIICLTRLGEEPAFEVAICEDEREAQDWAAALVTLLPGAALAGILSPRPQG